MNRSAQINHRYRIHHCLQPLIWLIIALLWGHSGLALALDEPEAEKTDWTAIYRSLVNQANQGDPKAQTTLGMIRLQGEVMPRDLKLARIWFGRAAVQNHTPAQFFLGQLLMLDVFGASTKDLELQLNEGMGWLRRASRDQHRQAQLLYATTILNSTLDAPFGHSKVEAEQFLNECADDYLPCTRFALKRLDERSGPRDGCVDEESCIAQKRWLNILANSHDVDAMYRLRTSPGEDSAFWLRRAARAGHAKASLEMAKLVLDGEMTLMDEDPALSGLLLRAAQAGEAEAMVTLADLLIEGRRMPYNQEWAIQWLEHASEMGDMQAQARLNALRPKPSDTAPESVTLQPAESDTAGNPIVTPSATPVQILEQSGNPQ